MKWTRETPAARGRPRAEHKLEKLVAYMPGEGLATARRAARAAGARSLSSWASQVLAREAARVLRTGEVPLDYFETEGPGDPRASVRKALRDERARGM
jgi:hypothetical protein